VLTTVDGAELGLLVAMRYLIVVIVIMRLRMTSMLIKRRQTIPRHEVQQVICTLCGTEQEVGTMHMLIRFLLNKKEKGS
ncbi:hypothetical protein Tco_1497851, partial [Tanacetum coccineum]